MVCAWMMRLVTSKFHLLTFVFPTKQEHQESSHLGVGKDILRKDYVSISLNGRSCVTWLRPCSPRFLHTGHRTGTKTPCPRMALRSPYLS